MSALLAALPMYDLPELREATNALWSAIAGLLHDQGVTPPAALTRDAALHAIWTAPNLLLAQTCGYPLVTSLAGRVRLVATPRYTALGCEGPLYRSAIMVRADDAARHLPELRGRRCAINDFESNSGWIMLRNEVASFAEAGRFFGAMLETGSHAASVDAVTEGSADVAAIDCVTWAHLQRLRPAATRGLRVLGWTAASPGLPLITAASTDEATHAALLRALDEVASAGTLAAHRGALLLEGFDRLPLAAYDGMAALAGTPIGCASATRAGTS